MATRTEFENQTETTTFTLDGVAMAGKRLTLPDLYAGDIKTFEIATLIGSGASRGTAKDLDAATTILILDPDRQVSGTATAGSTTTLVDAALAQADNFWIGVTLKVTIDSQDYYTEVTDSVSATGTLTFAALPVAVGADDTYTLLGYPLVPQAAVTVVDNVADVVCSVANGVTARPGNRTVILRAVFDDGSAEECLASLQVLASRIS